MNANMNTRPMNSKPQGNVFVVLDDLAFYPDASAVGGGMPLIYSPACAIVSPHVNAASSSGN